MAQNTRSAPLSQSLVNGLSTSLEGKPSFQQLTDAIATRQPLIENGSLTIARTDGLQTKLDEKLDLSVFTQANAARVSEIGTKHPQITAEAPLAQSLVSGLADSLSQKVSSQQLSDGLAARHPLITAQSPLSQSLVQGLTAALASQVDTSALLPNTGPATFTGALTVTNKVTAGAFETGYGVKTGHVIATGRPLTLPCTITVPRQL